MSLPSDEIAFGTSDVRAVTPESGPLEATPNLSDAYQESHSPGAESGERRPTAGKLFIGGLSWETSEDTLRSHFGKYGELTDVVIMKNRATGQPRGFGFVTYRVPETVHAVLADAHVLDGRHVEVKVAVPKEEIAVKSASKAGPLTGHSRDAVHGVPSAPMVAVGTIPILRLPAFLGPDAAASVPDPRKVFVGGLAPTVTDDSLRKYFERQDIGEILEAIVMMDKDTGRSRGFGFVTFSEEGSVEAVLAQTHNVEGRIVEVKRAKPKSETAMKSGMMAAGGAMLAIPGRFPGAESSYYGMPAYEMPYHGRTAPSPRVQASPGHGTATPMGSSPRPIMPASGGGAPLPPGRPHSQSYPPQRAAPPTYYQFPPQSVGYYVTQPDGSTGGGYGAPTMYAAVDAYGNAQPVQIASASYRPSQGAVYPQGYMIQSAPGAPMYFAAAAGGAMPMYYSTVAYGPGQYPPPHPAASSTPKAAAASPPLQSPVSRGGATGGFADGVRTVGGSSSTRHRDISAPASVKSSTPRGPLTPATAHGKTPQITPKTMLPTPSSTEQEEPASL